MASFEPRKTFEHVDKLSYEIGPRLAGTERSDQTSNYIKKKFEEFGLDTEIKTFEFINKIKKTRVISSILIGVFIAAFFLNLYTHPYLTFTISVIGLGAAYFLPSLLISKAKERNVIGTLKPENNPEKRIVIGAHYDSANCTKKWYMTVFFRVFLPIILVGFLTIMVYSIFFGTSAWLETWLILAFPYFFVCGIPFWNFESLVSPGAEDNASGVSVLLETARNTVDSDLNGVELKFVAFGAEEQGLKGSKAYVKDGISADVFLNLDSLGSGEKLCVVGGNGVLRKQETSSDLNESIMEELENGEIWTPFSKHDHIPFLNAGVKSTTLTSSNESQKNRLDGILESFFGHSNFRSRRLPKIHTIDDVPEDIRLENLERAGDILLSIIGINNEMESES